MTDQPTNQTDRIQVIDALRGFALAGIVLVHMVENYVGGPPPAALSAATDQGVLDSIVSGIMGLFIRGKFFALFSFLFGLSFFIQMDRGAKKGSYFGGRFLWRLLLLLGIGYVHHLFYRGDILTIYAMLGILLIPFYRVNKKWIITIVAIIFLGAFRYLVFFVFQGENLLIDFDMDPNSKQVTDYYDILKNGSFVEVAQSNATEGHLMKLDFQLGIFARGYLTFGFFLLGLLAGKSAFFQKFKNHKKQLKKGLIWSIVLFVMASIGMIALFAVATNKGQVPPTFDNWTVMAALSFYDLSNIFMTFILIIAFLLIYMKLKGERFLLKFSPYGRMALTNYVGQTVLGTFILYGWGLGLIGELRNIYTFSIGLAIIILQLVISKWWLDNFKYGPLEWLWRSLTYLKVFPLKKDL
ncbi:DUF418 domain-containing protein [Sungkyunkwania multivorans]|uniref:DUF418 domain-containing protein n=1 Tax=Sungkyunkwania multivorans TaxID=1173618 RepID=A0ABW3CSV9_9FLAO